MPQDDPELLLHHVRLLSQRLQHRVVSVVISPQSPTLQELYLSVTSLAGRLPDTVPRNTSLRAFFAIGLFDQQRRDPTNPGFTGPIPRSLLASKTLQYLVSSRKRHC